MKNILLALAFLFAFISLILTSDSGLTEIGLLVDAISIGFVGIVIGYYGIWKSSK